MKLLLASLLILIPFTVHAEYLGNLSANEFDPNSIANPFGADNPFSSNSVTNEFGRFGNPFSNQSATNPYATDAPRLYDQQGTYRGHIHHGAVSLTGIHFINSNDVARSVSAPSHVRPCLPHLHVSNTRI